jgi:serine protease
MLTRPKLRAPLMALLATALIALSAPVAARQETPPAAPVEDRPVSEIIVQFREGGELAAAAAASPEDVAAQLTELSGAELSYDRAGSVPGMHLLALPAAVPAAEAEAISARIAADPGVEYAEPNSWVTIARTPTDPRYAAQNWHLQAVVATGSPSGANNYAANLPGAWDITTGSDSITVAVIDTGGLLTHEDLAGRTPAGNPGFDMISNTFIANDGGGRDNNPADPGDWVTSADSATCGGAPPSNSSWHGSHVAGTIGASTNNGKGIAGINWTSRLLFLRALGKCGGMVSDIADAIRWSAGLPVAGLPTNPNPARVINMSLGGSGACPNSTRDAINAAVAAGAVVVVAAGNSNYDLDAPGREVNPGECANVITVAATDQDGFKATYSNYGTTVEISAPGGDNGFDPMIMSTVNTGTTVPVADTYKAYQGTSMATPHVAGVVSLMLSVNPSLTTPQVVSILQSTATPFPAYSDCSTSDCGAGILNATAAVQEAARLGRKVQWASASQNVSESAGSATVQVQLTVAHTSAITVPYTVSGTAGPADYTLAAGTLTFPAGATTASLTFPILDDTAVEPSETVVVTLGAPAGSPAPGSVGVIPTHTVTIVDNEGPPPPAARLFLPLLRR